MRGFTVLNRWGAIFMKRSVLACEHLFSYRLLIELKAFFTAPSLSELMRIYTGALVKQKILKS